MPVKLCAKVVFEAAKTIDDTTLLVTFSVPAEDRLIPYEVEAVVVAVTVNEDKPLASPMKLPVTLTFPAITLMPVKGLVLLDL